MSHDISTRVTPTNGENALDSLLTTVRDTLQQTNDTMNSVNALSADILDENGQKVRQAFADAFDEIEDEMANLEPDRQAIAEALKTQLRLAMNSQITFPLDEIRQIATLYEQDAKIRGAAAKIETGLFFAPAIEEMASRITPEAVAAYKRSKDLLDSVTELVDELDDADRPNVGDGEVYVREHVRDKPKRRKTAKA